MSIVSSQLEDGDSSPAHFFHKYGNPTMYGLQPNGKLTTQPALGGKSSPPSEPPRPSIPSGMQGGNPMKSSTTTTLNQRNLGPARQFTTGVPSPKSVLKTRYLSETNALLRRDPLSSYGET